MLPPSLCPNLAHAPHHHPQVRLHVPGFLRMEQQLASWLHRTHGTVVELFYAHGLRQSPETVRSTGFSVHQDTEDFDFIEYTIVAKLTPDEEGEAPSAMRVVGADRHFHYGGRAGDAGTSEGLQLARRLPYLVHHLSPGPLRASLASSHLALCD